MKMIKDIVVYLLISFGVIGIVVFQVVYAPREAMYDCRLIAVTPDYPSQAVDECRKAHEESFKKEQK